MKIKNLYLTSRPKNLPSKVLVTRGAGSNHSGVSPSIFFKDFVEAKLTEP